MRSIGGRLQSYQRESKFHVLGKDAAVLVMGCFCGSECLGSLSCGCLLACPFRAPGLHVSEAFVIPTRNKEL
eukprot:1863285-Amphidinium_carterae.1